MGIFLGLFLCLLIFRWREKRFLHIVTSLRTGLVFCILLLCLNSGSWSVRRTFEGLYPHLEDTTSVGLFRIVIWGLILYPSLGGSDQSVLPPLILGSNWTLMNPIRISLFFRFGGRWSPKYLFYSSQSSLVVVTDDFIFAEFYWLHWFLVQWAAVCLWKTRIFLSDRDGALYFSWRKRS